MWKKGLCRCNRVEMRSYWIRDIPNPMPTYKIKEIWTQKHTGRTWDSGDRDQSCAAKIQGMSELSGIHQPLGKRHETDFPLSPKEEDDPSNTLISDS